MNDDTKPVRVNVGTIGHVDHGRATLIQALGKVLGEVLGEVVVVDGTEIPALGLTDVDIHTHRDARYRSKRRKKERKARLAELQRKAFEGGRRP